MSTGNYKLSFRTTDGKHCCSSNSVSALCTDCAAQATELLAAMRRPTPAPLVNTQGLGGQRPEPDDDSLPDPWGTDEERRATIAALQVRPTRTPLDITDPKEWDAAILIDPRLAAAVKADTRRGAAVAAEPPDPWSAR